MADDRQSTPERQRVLRVGCTEVGSQGPRYYRKFSALEVQQTFFNPPRPETLRRQAALAPAGFGFIARGWQLITHEASSPGYRRLGNRQLAALEDYGLLRPTEAVKEAVRVTLESAAALKASALLFETPVSFTPSPQHRARLSEFFGSLDRDGRDLVWDPRGLWSAAETARIGADLNILVCRDPLDPETPLADPDERVYYRVTGLGRRPGLVEDDLLDLVARVQMVQGYCIFSTVEMQRDAARLLVHLEGGAL